MLFGIFVFLVFIILYALIGIVVSATAYYFDLIENNVGKDFVIFFWPLALPIFLLFLFFIALSPIYNRVFDWVEKKKIDKHTMQR